MAKAQSSNFWKQAIMSQLLHLVIGGRVRDPQGLDFVDLNALDYVGVFPDYASAVDVWRSAAQRSVDDAEMKYVVVHLHKLLELRPRALIACRVPPGAIMPSACAIYRKGPTDRRGLFMCHQAVA
jgi:hypothetical protein